MNCTLRHIEGLYIGDICYALNDDTYYNTWGKENHFEDGKFETKDGLEFAVAGTAEGDGWYVSNDGSEYGVDAGIIGVVDLRLATKYSIDELKNLGKIIPDADEAEFFADEGLFHIKTYKDRKLIYDTEIDTRYYY